MSSWTHTKDLPVGYWSDGKDVYQARGDGMLFAGYAWSGALGDLKMRPATPEEVEQFQARMREREDAIKMRDEEIARRADELKKTYGFDPREVGLRHRGFWVVEAVEWEESCAGAQVGDLCVKARDGAGNPPDMNAGQYGRYRGTAQDSFDSTYRYYYYAPLQPESEE